MFTEASEMSRFVNFIWRKSKYRTTRCGNHIEKLKREGKLRGEGWGIVGFLCPSLQAAARKAIEADSGGVAAE